MTAEAAASAERGLSRLRAAARGGEEEEEEVEVLPPLERRRSAGRRDEPTTTPPERESVIGDDDDENFIGEGFRGAAIAATCSLVPLRGSTRDVLAATAGLSVEAEARAFIITGGRLFNNRRREREHTHSTSPMNNNQNERANRFFALGPPLRHQEWLALSLERVLERKVCPAEEDLGGSEEREHETSARVNFQRDSEPLFSLHESEVH